MNKIIIAGFIVWLAFAFAAIYVTGHFIIKFW